jgi:uncharacterized membrane protein YhaH (DUF805 family)
MVSMSCPTCGKENKATAIFCGLCGTQLAEKSVVINSQTTGSENPIVGFDEAISLGFKNYFNFRTRATRAEYWWWALFSTLTNLVLSVVDTLTGTMGMFGESGLLSGFFELAILFPSLALGARRLHDIGKSGWWQLLWLAIIVGWIILIVWAIKQGNQGPNKYGLDPRATPK